MKFEEIFNKDNLPWNLLLDADPNKELVEKYIDKGRIFVLKEEKIVAVCVVIDKESEVVEIINLAVEEEFRGRGIGRKIINKVIEVMKQDQKSKIEIGTGNSSIGQLYLYQSCGFEMYELKRNFFVDNYEEEIIENKIRCKHMVKLMLNLK